MSRHRLARSQLDAAAVRLGHRAHDRQAEAAAPPAPAAVAVAADEAVEDPVAQLRRDAGAVVLTPRSRSSSSRRTRHDRRRCRAGVCTSAFWIRLSASRCSSSPGASTTSGSPAHVDLELVVGGQRRQPRPPPRARPRAGRPARGACAAGVGAREQQQVGHQPPHPARGAQRRARRSPRPRPRARAASSSRLARMLVSGVRSSCEASATNSAGGRAPPRSRRARRRAPRASPRASAPGRRPRRRPPASACCTPGSRVRAIVFAAVGELARSATWRAARREAGEQRERRAAEHAEERGTAGSAPSCAARCECGLAYWRYAIACPSASSSGATHAVAARPRAHRSAAARGRPRVGRTCGERRRRRGHDPDGRVAGRGGSAIWSPVEARSDARGVVVRGRGALLERVAVRRRSSSNDGAHWRLAVKTPMITANSSRIANVSPAEVSASRQRTGRALASRLMDARIT